MGLPSRPIHPKCLETDDVTGVHGRSQQEMIVEEIGIPTGGAHVAAGG